MSLSLLQGYSSAEEEDEDDEDQQQLSRDEFSSDGDEDENDTVLETGRSYKPLFDPNPPSSSSLPSAFEVFAEVTGPPQFLNNSVQEDTSKENGQRWRHGRGRKNREEKKDSPSGAVVESKAQLVGIYERVRTDAESNPTGGQSSGSKAAIAAPGGKRVATVGNPNAEDAAELLRMCVRCGIPKTYSHAKGIVCPMCGDQPAADSDKDALKKKGSTVKDKEKSKRMKGQSSHATWKSETEMQLRQQFD
ncbi:lipase class 3 family protein [Striga asiatica]|uniref:Lipase class 3 family protein n=1 Tax=Striga asiatica TaxID=4170 RepID=A0A5A7QQ25_STRAF|nr:lipase class 3 family protein [Striga asiatica]